MSCNSNCFLKSLKTTIASEIQTGMEIDQFIYTSAKGHTGLGYLLLHNELLQIPIA